MPHPIEEPTTLAASHAAKPEHPSTMTSILSPVPDTPTFIAPPATQHRHSSHSSERTSTGSPKLTTWHNEAHRNTTLFNGQMLRNNTTYGFISIDTPGEEIFIMPSAFSPKRNYVPPPGTKLTFYKVMDEKTQRMRTSHATVVDYLRKVANRLTLRP